MEGTAVLSHAVRGRVVARYLGQLAVVHGALAAVPAAVAALHGTWAAALAYTAVAAVSALVGAALQRFPAPQHVQANEALVVTALAFLGASMAMIPPFMVYGLTPVDAFFEAVSGVTTTGLSTLASVQGLDPSFLFTRAWLQWYGGLGILVLSVALLMDQQIATRQLAQPSVGESIASTARAHARRTLQVYLLLSLGGWALLALLLGEPFEALLYTLSSVSTGGFAPHDRSLAALPLTAAYTVSALALICAVPLLLWLRLLRGDWRAVFTDREALALLTLILLAATALATLQPGASLHESLLTAMSAQTTSGFTTLAPAELAAPLLLLLIVAMFIGGGLGSTAGGFKLIRALILLRLTQRLFRRTTLPPHAVLPARFAGSTIEPTQVERTLILLFCFIMTIVISWWAFLLQGAPPLPALFEVVSALGTVGLSAGVTAPELPTALKLVLCADMLLGRVELVALLIIFFPPTWLGKRADTS